MILSSLGLLVLLFLMIHQSIVTDVSLISPSHVLKEKADRRDFFELPLFLVSYADGNELYFRNQNTLAYSALNKDVHILCNYKRCHLDPLFVKENQKILNEKRGGGYWIWKPYFILKTMKMAPENATIVYADSGYYIKKPLQDLFTPLFEKNDIIISQQNPPETNGSMIKREVLRYFGCDTKEVRQSTKIQASFLALKNTPYARQFISEWLKHCCNPDLMTALHDPSIQHREFSYNADDQAILAGLYYSKIRKIHLIPRKELEPYIEWHHRKTEPSPTLPLLPFGGDGISKTEAAIVRRIKKVFYDFFWQ